VRTRTRTILAGLVLAAALVGGVAWATIPDAAGVINGCYRTSTDDQKGQLRVVDDPASCRSNETAIRWNERGVAGTTGAAGPAGAQGPKGDNGSAGAVGPQGPKGDTGAAGVPGVDGAPGIDGTNGSNGQDGAAGTPGNPCLPSNPACVGPQGPAGPSGGAGFTSTVTTLPLDLSGTFATTVVYTSQEWGAFNASCRQVSGETQLVIRVFATSNPVYLATGPGALILTNPVTLFAASRSPGLPAAHRLHGQTFTLLRFGTTVAVRQVVLAGEIFSDGGCRVTVAVKDD
jgi:hypothetical protein